MKITIESTEEIVAIAGRACRKWIGETEGGVPCLVYVPRISVAGPHQEAFDRERVPSPLIHTGDGYEPDGQPATPAYDARLLR